MPMVKNLSSFVLLFLGLAALASCSKSEPSVYQPELGKLPRPSLEVLRMEQLFFESDTTKIAQSLEIWQRKAPQFIEIFGQGILGQKQKREPLAILDSFLREPYARQLYDSTQAKFGNIEGLQKDLEGMLHYYSYYFPEREVPKRLYTFVSLYNTGAVLLEDGLALSLDFFLGSEHPGYMAVENLRHAYIRQSLAPPYIKAYFAQLLAQDIVDSRTSPGRGRLIEQMLYRGKKMYLAKLLLPETPDSILFAFSSEQAEYCQRGEQSLYEYMAKDINLFSDDFRGFRKFIEPGPFAPEQGLPGNSGTWLGMRIIKQYSERLRNMQIKGSLSPEQLREADCRWIESILDEDDAQTILRSYKPLK